MDTCVRGFSFMPEDNAANELKYIEGEELERTWKSTRRLRVKKREEKIWDEFVKEQDIVHSVCEDDPYQFLEELPEECLKELMKSELQKMKNEQILEELEAFQSDDAQQYMVEDDVHAPQHVEEVHHISYNEDDEGDDGVFHIFDSEKDDISGQEDNQIDSTGSPCTVRENKDDAQSSTDSPELRLSGRKEKPAENVAHVIESSIYCAKVKDLRTKLCEELSSIVTTLENQDLSSIEGNELARMCKRSNEFCIRFNRIHMYQLQRQLQDLKRHTRNALPFAKHTQFQSLMVRVVSLHQNMLQAYQVFNKSIEQTACLRESSTALAALIQATRQASDLCKSAPAPKDFAAITDLYNDELLVSCQELEASMHVYNSKVTEYMQDNDTNSLATSRKSNRKCFGKKSGVRAWSKPGPRSGNYFIDLKIKSFELVSIRFPCQEDEPTAHLALNGYDNP
ncbi:uncharacterized protein LOC114244964 [Bombyx mandarina]|uniref:Uncharacterized protein LOC114244964 n=1 Tax=Bombyx mandarina TaxID=7092 RepID=A0A6J2JSE9_BOMMA|nr:uncharacterized protein LOC114244964 [Bombyx mandarina]